MKKHHRERIPLDGWRYTLDVYRGASKPADSVRLLIPAFQPNSTASAILRACLDSIRRYTDPDAYELWVIDSNSPDNRADWLLDYPGINVALNRTEPRPPEERSLWKRASFWRGQTRWGSYANAVGLELATRLLAPETKQVMTLHMDVMACHQNWLPYLISKLDVCTHAVGVCFEKCRFPEGVLHILGCLFDYQKVKSLGIDFFPELPRLDVGDKITLGLREAGSGFIACKNTYENPEYVELIPSRSAFHTLNVVRVFDDDWNVIFMHLGRGIPKADMRYGGKTASAEEWISFSKGQE